MLRVITGYTGKSIKMGELLKEKIPDIIITTDRFALDAFPDVEYYYMEPDIDQLRNNIKHWVENNNWKDIFIYSNKIEPFDINRLKKLTETQNVNITFTCQTKGKVKLQNLSTHCHIEP